jgi:N-hydroxyarylamine O-acetyltransferase
MSAAINDEPMMEIQRYLKRIGYTGPTAPTLQLLRDVHRHHVCTIPYENLDVILQRPVDQDPGRIFRKIVDERRGGWCYEMNGLLGWALTELGFDVARLCGGVMRQFSGDEAFGNHLVLLVTCEGREFIADAGLGDGILEPIALVEGDHEQYQRSFRLERLSDNEWRFHNRQDGMPPSFDFFGDSTTETKLAQTGEQLQTDPQSMFRQNLICQRINETGGKMMLGRVIRDFHPEVPRRLLQSEDELLQVLRNEFNLQPPPIAGLWESIVTRHTELFGDTAVEDIQFGPPVQDQT